MGKCFPFLRTRIGSCRLTILLSRFVTNSLKIHYVTSHRLSLLGSVNAYKSYRFNQRVRFQRIVNSRWHRAWARLSQMDREEMRVRTRQEIGKRLDLMAAIGGYRFGLRNAPTGFGGKFFFPPDEIPERITLLNEFLPAQVSQIISEADNICRHRFNLLGYPGLDYGEEIDWHLDAVHGKRAARRPWYWINYLNFAKTGDHKVIWELNRHQHLVTLAKAWSLTGETRYLAELIKQWHSWQAANRYPLGINWASSLEVAFRSLSWLWVANLLADSESAKDLLADLAGARALSGRHIERYLSTYFSPNTHLLGEGVGLFFIGTLCPKLANANRWKDKGWEIVVEASKRQVLADGMYFEQALHYHVYALDFFLHTRTLAAHNGMEITGEFDAVIQKMLDVLAALSQAGPAEGFGDDDGGRVFDPRRNRTEHMTDPLAMGASLYGEKYARGGAKLTEEAIWLFGKCAVEALREHAMIRSQAFATGGLYVLASKEPCPQQMVVDAGPQGTGPSGHGHADALSLRMAVDGQRFLIDPGT